MKNSWGMCPNCSVDLSESIKTRPPHDKCPFCGKLIRPIWWQRTTVALLGLLLAFTVPSWVGLAGWDVYFAGLFLFWPALVFAHILFLRRSRQNMCDGSKPLRHCFTEITEVLENHSSPGNGLIGN
jgi:hypothetical protein